MGAGDEATILPGQRLFDQRKVRAVAELVQLAADLIQIRVLGHHGLRDHGFGHRVVMSGIRPVLQALAGLAALPPELEG